MINMRPNNCTQYLGDGQCLKGQAKCVELKGILCTVYDPVEEDYEEEQDV